MSQSTDSENEKPKAASKRLLESGIIFSAVCFLTGLGNLAFQAVMGRHLNESGQYGNANSALSGFMPLLGLLPSIGIFAVAHHIAHFNASGDTARLQGLLLGCRKFLVRLTIAGSVLAILLVKPLSHFFHYSESLTLVTLVCALLGLWAALATALCQGLAWFKRLAIIGFLAMLFRVLFGWFVTLKWPSAETATLATAFSLLANLVLLVWKKELSLHGDAVSPWNRDFIQYFILSAAFAIGNYCFFQGDLLVANKFFSREELDAYTAAGVLARALPVTVAPLLVVLFTSRSGQSAGSIVSAQFKLAGLSGLGLILGASCLFVLRTFCLKILGKYSPEAAAMIGRFAMTMVFVGLLQSIAYWSLASRWQKTVLLYGALGLGYWLILLRFGKIQDELVNLMPLLAGIAFAILFIVWIVSMKRHASSNGLK